MIFGNGFRRNVRALCGGKYSNRTKQQLIRCPIQPLTTRFCCHHSMMKEFQLCFNGIKETFFFHNISALIATFIPFSFYPIFLLLKLTRRICRSSWKQLCIRHRKYGYVLVPMIEAAPRHQILLFQSLFFDDKQKRSDYIGNTFVSLVVLRATSVFFMLVAVIFIQF